MGLLTIPLPSPHKNDAYATLGRAIALASEFESDCQIVALALEFRAPSMSDEAFFSQFARDLFVLSRNHQRIVADLGLSEPAIVALNKARIARNYIVHEAGVGFESKVNSEKAWSEWVSTMREKLDEIAVGRQVISILTSRVLPAVPKPTKEQLSDYRREIVDWVFS